MNAISHEEEEPHNEVDKALRKLVNVERIDEPAEYGRKLTMMKEAEKKRKIIKGKSVPIPPTASGMIGANATLSQITTVKGVS
jgi:GMP synthase PP-ATPase subunit